ncbi:chaperone protein dnaJ 8, chloroplastic [Alnus glutinosa]|uniref:chaperone protein dnaJ 8, chloroplastic n=1 Tax=Alnus glutinosa TaxID=3517 RepID=UPI002D786423|nr:chaperone protein dnaJ 8, chloroplastic [Alnus glutinosa]
MAAATAAGLIGGNGSSSSSWFKLKDRQRKKKMVNRVMLCSASSSVMDPYQTLRIQPNASESDVKKAFRKLALQYHPDVCRGSNCGVQFHQINEAYDIAMSNLRGESQGIASNMYESYDEDIDDDAMRGMNDPDWDMWEEWMGWEGAGIRDYTSHINPYI